MKSAFWLLFLILITVVSCAIDQPPLGGRQVPYGPFNPLNPPIPQASAGPPVFQGPSQTEKTLARDSAFPYDLIPDTLTAVTCPQYTNIGNQNFTLAIGAYRNHGLQLSSNFLKNNDITSNTPAQKIRQLIERSPFKKAVAAFALLDESNLYPISSQSRPVRSFFPRFNNPTTLNLLSRRIPTFTSRSQDRRRVGNAGKFQASLPITGSNLVYWAPSMGEGSQGNLLPAVFYTLNGGKSPIYYSTDRLYGRSYKLEFEDPYKANYLTDVREEKLINAKKEGQWSCPESLRFMIHRATRFDASPFNRQKERYKESLPPGTLEEGYCDVGRRPNGTERDFFLDIFGSDQLNQLPFELGWSYHISLKSNGDIFQESTGPCVKFRRPGCYPSSGYYRIEFNPDEQDDCVRNNQIFDRSPKNPELYKICPAFLSICYRK